MMRFLPDLRYSDHHLLDVYQPLSVPEGAIVLLHRGWLGGDKRDEADLATKLCKQGFVVFAVNFRLPPHTPFSFARIDALAALNWALNSEFPFDRSRVAVMGTSVGGTIAVEVAMAAGLPGVSWSGVMDMKDFMERTGTMGDRDYDHDFSLVTALDTESGGRNDALLRTLVLQLVSNNISWLATAEPLSRVREDSGPVMLFNSLAELVPGAGAISMQSALTAAGVCSTVCMMQGKRHGKGYMDEALDQSVEFFLRAFEKVEESGVHEKALKQEQDDYLDEALMETFPGSDPISPGHVSHAR